jgi:photosystem II stability/assembly factor-like uncharacterized protein
MMKTIKFWLCAFGLLILNIEGINAQEMWNSKNAVHNDLVGAATSSKQSKDLENLAKEANLSNVNLSPSYDLNQRLSHRTIFDESGNLPFTMFGKKVFRKNEVQGQTPSYNSDAGYPWNSIGPWGGDVFSIASSLETPATLYAAAGLPFIKYDASSSWILWESLAAYTSNVNLIATAPGGIIYVSGGNTLSFFKSNDGGLNWIQLNIPTDVRDITALSIDPTNSNIVYIGLGSSSGATNWLQIIKTTDGGSSWQTLNTSNLNIDFGIADIAIFPNNPSQLVAAAYGAFGGGEVIYSNNSGETWQIVTNNLPNSFPFNDIEIAESTVYLGGGQLFGSQYLGLYKCILAEFTWQNISTGFPLKVVTKVLVSPEDSLKIYAGTDGDGVYFSTDGGLNWDYSSTGASNFSIADMIFYPNSAEELFIGCKNTAVYRSQDAGLNWEVFNMGIATLAANDIAIDPQNSNNIIVAFESWNSGGCYMSNDGGNTWDLVWGLPATRFSAVTYDINSNVYAVSQGPSSVAQEGVYKSIDGGITWTNTGPNIGSLFETELWTIEQTPTQPGLLFVGGNHFGVAGHAATIYKTLDGGQSGWEEVYIGSDQVGIHAIEIAPFSDEQLIYAGYVAYEGTGSLLKSTDQGIHWVDINNGLINNCCQTYAIAVDPLDPQKVLAGSGHYSAGYYIVKTEDGGENWTPIFSLPSQVGCLAYIEIPIPLIKNQEKISCNGIPKIIYAGTSGNGVFLSDDDGLTWLDASEGLPFNTWVSNFSDPFLAGNSLKINASTVGHSAYSTIVAIIEGIDELGKDEVLTWNEPNPFSQHTTIHFMLRKNSNVHLSILNMNGQQIATLLDQQMSSGVHQYTWNATSNGKKLAKGLYFYRLTIDGKDYFNKLIIQ